MMKLAFLFIEALALCAALESMAHSKFTKVWGHLMIRICRDMIAAAAVAMFVSTAYAEDQKFLSVDQTIRVTNGLSQLDKYDGICKDGAIEKTCPKFYNLGMGIRLAIARNMDKGTQVGKIYTAQRQALIARLSGGNTKVPDDKMAEFIVEDQKSLDAASGVTMEHIKRSDLKLDENPIPATVLYMIIPIMDDQ